MWTVCTVVVPFFFKFLFLNLFYYLTNCMGQSHSWKLGLFKYPAFYRTQSVPSAHSEAHVTSSFHEIWMIPRVCVLFPHPTNSVLFKFHINAVFPAMLRSCKESPSFGFLYQNPVYIFLLPLTCPSHLILVDLITCVIFDDFQTMKCFSAQLSPILCFLLPLTS